MYGLDLEQFWKDDALAHEDNCFSERAPQVALGIRMSAECVYAELGEEGNPWGPPPPRERRLELYRRYNDKAEQIVGRRLLPDDLPPEDAEFPAIREIGEVFGGRYEFNGHSTWLRGSCSTPQELEKVLDRVDRMDFRAFVLPPNWEQEKKRIFEKYGYRPGQYMSVRGPVTLATTIYGVENLIFLIIDEPELAKRFSDTIARVILQYIELMIEESGGDQDHFIHGFNFCDDDSNLLTPDMYEFFGYPVLEKVFARTSPDIGDIRYQHSDSAMGHLLPILSRLNLTGCNFGPTLTVAQIRQEMPRTRIDGQLAPFTFMSNDEKKIIQEVKRDCQMAIESGVRGLNLSTAGSINNGSLLTSMRAVMYAIQNYGRY